MKKLSPRAYTLMWDAHSATGIVIGLALFVLFFTGALLLFRGEIRQWEEPALRADPGPRRSLDALVAPVFDSLGRGAAPPSYVLMEMPEEHAGSLYLYLAGNTVRPSHTVWVNPVSGDWVSPPRGGETTQMLYYLHFFYQLGRGGLYLAGVMGLFMILALVTGTVVHWRRLVNDFFQFRPRKALRVAWADAHKVLGTIGLPFQALYAFTGAFLGLLGLFALPYAALLYNGNATQMYRDAGYYAPAVPVDSAAGTQPVRLQALVNRAAQQWAGFDVNRVIASGLGTARGRVEVLGQRAHTVFGGTGAVVFHAATGELLLRRPPAQAGPLNVMAQSMERLHFAAFGGRVLDVLFLLLALAACAVILTGNFTWLAVRKQKDRVVHRLLARITAGVATGLVPATALVLLADRFLPEAQAAWWANLVFFGSWLACVGYALVRRHVARTHRTLLVVGGVLALLMPVANGVTTGDWPWEAWQAGRWAVWGVDVGALVSGLVALGLAACLTVEEEPSDGPPDQEGARRKPVVRPEDAVLKTA